MSTLSEAAEDVYDHSMSLGDVDEREPERCTLCLGSGACPECHGTGALVERLNAELKERNDFLARILDDLAGEDRFEAERLVAWF